MDDRLPSHVEVGAIIRQVEANGGFATVLRKGDPDRGAVTLILQERGEFRGIMERELGADFRYEWTFRGGSSESLDDLTARKLQFDPDFWLIELDIADPERFIAETTGQG
jgi:hypothetical protein